MVPRNTARLVSRRIDLSARAASERVRVLIGGGFVVDARPPTKHAPVPFGPNERLLDLDINPEASTQFSSEQA
jgi:hypothetical protein